MSKLRVFIITQEEPFYVPKVMRHVLERQGDAYEVVGATVLMPHRKNKTMRHWFRERSRIYTPWELFLACSCFTQTKLTPGANCSAARAFRDWGVELHRTKDVNAEAYVQQLENMSIDVIISVSPPQIFQRRLLNLPAYCCINAHGTLLPRHRGVFGSWWTLYCGDEVAGATIHTMEEELDAGEIIWQRAVLVDNDTQYSVAFKTKMLIAHGLVEVLQEMARDGRPAAIAPVYAESFHYAPTEMEGKAFHKKGLRVMRWRDRRGALARSFEV